MSKLGLDSDIAVVEFCYGDPLEWHTWAYVGTERSNCSSTYYEEIVGITGIRVRPLSQQKEVGVTENDLHHRP